MGWQFGIFQVLEWHGGNFPKIKWYDIKSRGVNGILLPVYSIRIVSENTGKGKIFFPLANRVRVRAMIFFFRYLTRFRI